jgi:hypothetical protein
MVMTDHRLKSLFCGGKWVCKQFLSNQQTPDQDVMEFMIGQPQFALEKRNL